MATITKAGPWRHVRGMQLVRRLFCGQGMCIIRLATEMSHRRRLESLIRAAHLRVLLKLRKIPPTRSKRAAITVDAAALETRSAATQEQEENSPRERSTATADPVSRNLT